MWAKLIPVILNWVLANLILPAVNFLWDVISLKKKKKQVLDAVEDLKKAKTQKEIDEAIDRLP